MLSQGSITQTLINENAKNWSHDPHGSILLPISGHMHVSHDSLFSPMKSAFIINLHPYNYLQKTEPPSLVSKEVFSKTLHYISSNVF